MFDSDSVAQAGLLADVVAAVAKRIGNIEASMRRHQARGTIDSELGGNPHNLGRHTDPGFERE